MTPDDIRSQRFNTRLLQGLSREEVSAFLEDVAEAFGNLQEVNGALRARVKALEVEIQTRVADRTAPAALPVGDHLEELRSAVLKEVAALLHDAHAQATTLLEGAREREAEILREAETIRARRQGEADELLAAATARAEALVVAAREQEAVIRDEIDRLTTRHLQVVDDVRATLDSYHQWLATIDPRGRARGRRETREDAEGIANGSEAASGSMAG